MQTITVIVTEQRDGWCWRIEPQDGCEDNGGVDIVYDQGDGKSTRICIGSLADATALARAINTYVTLTQNHVRSSKS